MIKRRGKAAWGTGVCTLALGVVGLWAWRDNITIHQREQAAKDYKTSFIMRSLPSGWNADFGLHPLIPASDLHGALCWVGHRNQEVDAQQYPFQRPVLQRVLLQPRRAALVENFGLPAHDSQAIDFVGQPLFSGNQNKGFFRVSRLGQDYAYYDVFRFNMRNHAAVSQGISTTYWYTFLPSPDSNFYAYDSADAHYDDPYGLSVNKAERSQRATDQVVSEQKESAHYSWTSDNHILYSAYGPRNAATKYHYPYIYENDLCGKVKLVKKGGLHPVFNTPKTWLAYVGPDTRLPKAQQTQDEMTLNPITVSRKAIFTYDVRHQKEYFVARIEEESPELLWVGNKLYVVENSYAYSKQKAMCRITTFDRQNRKVKVLCTVEQQGLSSSSDDLKFAPRFEVVGVANVKSLLLHVPVKQSGADNYHLLSISLSDGTRRDRFSFSAPLHSAFVNDFVGTPYIAWVNAPEQLVSGDG